MKDISFVVLDIRKKFTRWSVRREMKTKFSHGKFFHSIKHVLVFLVIHALRCSPEKSQSFSFFALARWCLFISPPRSPPYSKPKRDFVLIFRRIVFGFLRFDLSPVLEISQLQKHIKTLICSLCFANLMTLSWIWLTNWLIKSLWSDKKKMILTIKIRQVATSCGRRKADFFQFIKKFLFDSF